MGRTRSLKRRIARWLGYGGVEWPRSAIIDFPIKHVTSSEYRKLVEQGNIITVFHYPGGIQVLPEEVGCDGKNRLLYHHK